MSLGAGSPEVVRISRLDTQLSSSEKGEWVPLMDYAALKGVSLSTLRRYIKADKVRYRIENGRYLLWLESGTVQRPSQPMQTQTQIQNSKHLEQKLKEAHEEIAELKMLIALYEEKLPANRLDC